MASEAGSSSAKKSQPLTCQPSTFLNETCPICNSYTTIRSIQSLCCKRRFHFTCFYQRQTQKENCAGCQKAMSDKQFTHTTEQAKLNHEQCETQCNEVILISIYL